MPNKTPYVAPRGRRFRAVAGVLAVLLLLAFRTTERAHGEVLYDGTLNTLPAAQGWTFIAIPGTATESVGGGVTTLNTLATLSEQAGYGRNYPGSLSLPLDRTAGYNVRMDLRVASESHTSADRSGASMLIIGDDLMGIELALWENEVWAQNDSPLFTHGEGNTAVDTTAAITQYDVRVLGGSYTLLAGGSPILSGPLRDYSSFGFPYDTASSIFLGDDTTSGQAEIELAYAELTPIPEPAGILLAVLAAGAFAAATWRRRKGAVGTRDG